MTKLPPRNIIVGCDEQHETRTVTDQKTLRLLEKIAPRTFTIADDLAAKHEGWALFDIDNGNTMIQRLDDPGILGDDFPQEPVFKSDTTAITFVRRHAEAGSELHKKALALHGKPTRKA